MTLKEKKFHWKPKYLNAVAIAQFTPIKVDLSQYPETDKLNSNRFHPRDQVGLHVGDIVCVLQDISGWYRGYVFSPSNPQSKPQLGIFPSNHVINIRKRDYKDPTVEKNVVASIDDVHMVPDTRSVPDETIVDNDIQLVIKASPSITNDILNQTLSQINDPSQKVSKKSRHCLPDASLPFYITKYASEDPLIDEVTVVLRDWFFNLKQSLKAQDYKSYALIKKNVNNLLRGRRQLLARKHVGQNLSSVRQEILTSISEGNEMQKIHQVIRDKETGEIITPKLATVMKMHQIHTHLQWQVNPESKKQQPRSFDVFDQEYLQKEENQIQFHHFYIELKEVLAQLPQEFEAHFQLIIKSDQQPLSETFVIKFDQNKPTNHYQYLITNLAPADASLDTLLIAKVYKREPFSDKCAETVVRRPLGVFLLECKDIFNGKESQPTNGFLLKYIAAPNETQFGKFFNSIIEVPQQDIAKVNGCYCTCKTLVGELESLLKSTTMFDPKQTTLVNRTSFPSVITPQLARNKIHITLKSADFAKSVSRNIEIAIQLRNNYTGQVIDHSMSMGRGLPNLAVFESSLHYHALNPIYMETFTVDCPLDILTDSHLYFAIRALHTSDKERKETKVTSFSFLPIKKDNKMILNGNKQLQVFKYEKSKTSPGTYLSLNNEHESGDVISVHVNLCSSKYPQTQSLFSLLNYKKMQPSIEELIKYTTDLKQCKESECLFSLAEILDTCFELVQLHDNPQLHQCIFNSILHVIGLTQDNKYSKFEPTLMAYISSCKHPKAHEFILSHLIQLMNDHHTNLNLQYVKEVRNAFKSVSTLFCLIFQSRIISNTPVSDTAQITVFIDAICAIMASTNDTLLGTQTTILQYLDKLMIVFLDYFGPLVTTDYAIQCSNSIHHKKSTIINYKLVFLMNLVKSPLYKHKDARPLLSVCIANYLTIAFLDPGTGDKQSRQQVFRKCVFVLAETLDTMQSVTLTSEDYKSLQLFAKLLPLLIDVFDDQLSTQETTTKLQTRSSIGLATTTTSTTNTISPTLLSGVIAATMLILFHLLGKQELVYVFQQLEFMSLDTKTRFMTLFFKSITSMLQGEAFPQEWANLSLLTLTTCLKMNQIIAMMAIKYYRNDKQCWSLLMKSLLMNCMSLTNRPHSQQYLRTMQIYRLNPIEAAQTCKSCWDMLEWQSQLQLTNELMTLVVQLSTSPFTVNQQQSAYMLYTMMKREFQFCKSIHRITTMIIDELDIIFQTQVQVELTSHLKVIHQYSLNESADSNSTQFDKQMTKSIEQLSQYCSLVQELRILEDYGDEYEQDRYDTILKLAFFMKSVGKKDMAIKYLQHLSNAQLAKNNFVEAGLTMLHQSQLMESKEDVLMTIIEYFDEGKAWEKAIQLIQDLIIVYRDQEYDYKKLSLMLKRQAQLYDSILTKERYHSEYFRVGFYGLEWPISLRNKLFIYRGFEFEKISVFCERILNKHAGALMLKNNNQPGDDVLLSKKKHIQITAVQPEPLMTPLLKNDVVSDVIKSYYLSNEIQHFSFSRPFRKEAKTGNEFLDLWTQKTIYKTVERFPHALKRSLIGSLEVVEYSPIENALKTMVGKNKELLMLEATFTGKDASKLNCNPLTMSLNGSVDAPVNGGVPMYKKAFLLPEFSQKYPDKKEFVPQLADAIDEQIIIISRCLDVHAKVVPMAMRPLHENLVKLFLKNYGEDIERLGIPPPSLDVMPMISINKTDDSVSFMSKESGEQASPLKEMDKNSTIRMKKERGSSMALNDTNAKDRLLSKAFGKKGAPS